MENLSSILIVAAVLVVLGSLVGPRLFAAWGGLPDNADEIRDMVRHDQALVVDVRTPREFAGNGLDDAINLPLQQLGSRHRELGSQDTALILYCRSGNRSNQAKQLLEQLGYTHIIDLGSHGRARKVLEDQS